MPELVHQGSVVELMFHTHRGPVLSTVEMLRPVTSAQQPFRFVALAMGLVALMGCLVYAIYIQGLKRN